MKIGVIDPSFFTIPYDHCLCQGLAEDGHDVTLYGRPLRFKEEFPAHDYKVEFLFTQKAEKRLANGKSGAFTLALKGIEYFFDTRELIRTIERENFDVIHIQWAPLPQLDARLFSSLKKLCPLVFTVHDTNPFHGSSSSRLQMFGINQCLQLADMLVVHTNFSRNALIAVGCKDDRITVIPHGVLAHDAEGSVSEEWVEYERRALEFENRLLLLGAVKPYKGADVLFRAFAALPPDIRSNTAVMVCGELKMPVDELKILAEELGITDNLLWWTDWLMDAEVQRASELATIRTFPYREIDASGALLQAMPLGRAIVAARVGGFANLFTDELDDYLFEAEDWQACADILKPLLQNEAERVRLGGLIRKKSDTIDSWNTIAKKTVQMYRSVVRVVD